MDPGLHFHISMVNRRVLLLWIYAALGACLAFQGTALAQNRARTKNYGYVKDLREERELQAQELEFVYRQDDSSDKDLREKIFNEELSDEFRKRYEREFGFTEMEQRYNMPSRINTNSQGDSAGGTYGFFVSNEQTVSRQREFAGYMLRRLTEFHADNYAKNDPSLRPAYQFKDKISSANVEMAPGYKFAMKYSLADNSVDMKLQNPYVRSNANVAIGNGNQAIRETTVNIGREVTRTINVDSYYRFRIGQVQLVGTKRLTQRLSTSLMGATTVISEEQQKLAPMPRPPSHLVLGGVLWNY